MIQETGIQKNAFDLEFYYERHCTFYGLVVQKTLELERYSSELKRLSIRWVENKTAILADNEVGEFTCLIQGLQNILDNFETTRFWTSNLEEARFAAVCFSPQNAELNDLILDWIVLLNVEEQAFQKFVLVASSLRKATELLNKNPFFAATKIDPSMLRSCFRLLLIATAMFNENAEEAKEALKNVQSNETRWREIEEKVRGRTIIRESSIQYKTVGSSK